LHEALIRVGTELGLAFQIQDDIFDVVGTAAEIGKPVLSDIRQGQQTFLTRHVALEGADAERQLLEKVMSGLASDIEVESLKEVILRGGALEAAKARAAGHVAAARVCLAAAEIEIEVKNDMAALIALMAERTS
jgi:geranylgeranyl pyrophosphate synthase